MSTTVGSRGRRSGRPYRPPEDRADPTAALPDLRMRAAWLLGTSRVASEVGGFAQRRDFLPALHAAGISCDESRLSRWESGAVAPPVAVITAYEALLALPAYSLRGALDLLRPAGDQPYGLVPDLDADLHGRLDHLLDRALRGHATGLEWIELAQLIEGSPQVYLRGSDWSRLADQLLGEHSRAVREAFTTRTSALAALIANPAAQRHVVRSIGGMVLEGRAVRLNPAVRLLGHLRDARGSTLALRLMDNPAEGIRRSAAHAVAGMLADGAFDEAQLDALEEHLGRGIRADAVTAHADVALRLPDEVRGRVEERLQHPLLNQLTRDHELALRPVARQVSRRFAAYAHGHTPVSPDEPDRMLARLCREALFHVHFRRRQAACALISASPFAGAVAAAAALALDHEVPLVGRQAARLLAWTGTPSEADTLLHHARSAADPLLSRNCLLAWAQLPLAADDQAVGHLLEALRNPAPMVRDAAVYALGMHGLAGVVLPHVDDDAQLDQLGRWVSQGSRVTD